MRGKGNGVKIIAICLAGALTAGAFLLPSGLFALQDKARAQQRTIGVREKVSLENLSENYEQSLHNRLSILAERLGDERNTVYVSESEVTLTDTEKMELLLKLAENDLGYLYTMGYTALNRHASVEPSEDDVWKCYVIYDTQGILTVCYYIELRENDIELQMLVDAEDGTLYCEQGIYLGQNTLKELGYLDYNMAIVDGEEVKMRRIDFTVYRWIAEKGGKVEKIAFWDFLINILLYYEVDYIEGSGYKEQYDYSAEMDKHEINYEDEEFAEYLEEKFPTSYSLAYDDWWIQMELAYGDGRITWEMNDGRRRLYGDNGMAEFFQGFPALAELIPEYGDYEIYEETEEEF
ncbi:MAG: hypothetical protein NC092_07410 [Butyrivibrio sp.]|nr:hypothetical protein [Muribaculum sp.]MCM1552505.1 hypothetical protein [Butyrivibrio sp.]